MLNAVTIDWSVQVDMGLHDNLMLVDLALEGRSTLFIFTPIQVSFYFKHYIVA